MFLVLNITEAPGNITVTSARKTILPKSVAVQAEPIHQFCAGRFPPNTGLSTQLAYCSDLLLLVVNTTPCNSRT